MKRLHFALTCLAFFALFAIFAGCASNRGKDRPRQPKGPVKKTAALSSEDAYRIAGLFESVAAFRNPSDGKTKLAVGTRAGYLHLMDFNVGGLRLEWQSPYLGGPVRGVQVKDFQGNGVSEIMVYTGGGRLIMMEMEGYSVARENAAFDMSEIDCAVAIQLDDDPALEILACGGDRFAVYDGATLFKEWEAPGTIPGEWLAVGDVDGDGMLEVVLNSGYVLDAKFFRIKTQLGRLGERIELMDVDGDGVDEILAEDEDGGIAVYDARMPGIPEF